MLLMADVAVIFAAFNLYIILSCYIYYDQLNCIVMVFYDNIIMWLSCDPEILSFSSKV